MSSEYEQAKKTFYADLGLSNYEDLSDKELEEFGDTRADDWLMEHIEWQYEFLKESLKEKWGKIEPLEKISQSLQSALSHIQKAPEGGDDEEWAANMRQWELQVRRLIADVEIDLHMAKDAKRILGGGERKRTHFFEKKLKVDTAIGIIEEILGIFYKAKGHIRWPGRRLYHGAGLLHYLGFDWSNLLKPGTPFPDHLNKDDLICRQYHARRKEAVKYVTLEARDKLHKSLTSPEHKDEMFEKLGLFISAAE